MDKHTKLATVRFLAAHKRPYFATALFAMHLVPTADIDTMGVDKYGRVYINPDMIHVGSKPPPGGWSVEEAASVLVHELGHWLRKHHERGEPLIASAATDDRETVRDRVNRAQDCELNDDLKNEGLPLPGDPPMPHKYGFPEGRLWEEYYQLLLKNPPPPTGGGRGRGGGNAPGVGARSGKGTDKCDCGSGAHGQSRAYELPAPGGADKQPGIGDAEGDLLRQQVAREIQSASRGTVPAGWQRWAEKLLEPPVVPWERELAALVHNAVTMARGMADYSYAKISRRGGFYGKVIMPAMVRPNPDAAVVLDTSGSMNGDLLSRALVEIKGILRAVGQRKVPVLCCDAKVHGGIQRVSSALEIELSGGGGTDMGVGIEAAQALRASVIIVLTDGYTPWPAQAPRGCQLVVGILNPESPWETSYPPPGYAKRVLRIQDPKAKVKAA